MGEKRKVVLFNLEREEERELWEYAARIPNFSGRVKAILARELAAMKRQQAANQQAAAQSATLQVKL